MARGDAMAEANRKRERHTRRTGPARALNSPLRRPAEVGSLSPYRLALSRSPRPGAWAVVRTVLAASPLRRAAAGVAPRFGFLRLLPARAASLLARLALLLAALALAVPAAAQTSATLVSNNGRTFIGSAHSGDLTRDRATSFTTGASRDGYTLTGLTLYMRKNVGTINPSYTVTVNADDPGRPGTILGTLSTTESIPVSTTTYGAVRFSGTVNLAANSTYWVVLDTDSFLDSRFTRISGTRSDNEDSGAFPGWSIGDTQLRRISDRNTVDDWGDEITDALRMNLRGYGRGTGPVLRSARVSRDGTKLTLYYDEELDPNSVPAHARFSTNVGGTGQALPRDGSGTQREAPVTVAGSTVTMNLVVDSANAVTSSQTVAMGYNAAAAPNPIRNLGRVKATRLSGLPVTNDRDATQPTITTASIVSTPSLDTDSPADGTPETYGEGARIQVQLTFSEAVTVDVSAGTPRLKIKLHEDFGEKWADYESGSGTTNLTFAYTVVSGDSSSGGSPVTDTGIAVLTSTLELNGGIILSTATGRPSILLNPGRAHNSDHKVNGSLDGQGPRFRIATVRDTALVIVFDENLNATSLPAGSSVCVTATSPDGTDRRICGSTAVFDSVHPTNLNVSLAGGGVRHGEVVTVGYTKPDSNFLKDGTGNAVESFSDEAVTNNTIGIAPVTIDSVSQGTESGSLSVNWTAPTTGGVQPTGYDLRYYAGSEDPPAGREADWIEVDPGTATSLTIKGLKANTAYRAQLRGRTSAEIGPWTASVGQTTAAAPDGNNAPRVLINNFSGSGNVCAVDTDPLGTLDRAGSEKVTARSNTLGSYVPLTGRRSETTTLPTICSPAGGRTVPLFDDMDGDTLMITAEPYLLPANVRVAPNGIHVTQQTSTLQGRVFFKGSAMFRKTNVWMKLTATDEHGASVSTNRIGFALEVIQATKGAPSFGTTVPDQNAFTSREFSLVLPAATGGDVSLGSAEQLDLVEFPYFYRVTGLPKGLVFDEATLTISGTPLETGTFTVTYTADDADDHGSEYLNPRLTNTNDVASEEFTITVAVTPHIDLVRVVSAPTHDANGDGKNDTYGEDDKIVIDVEYSEPVEVKGTIGTANGVRLRLDVGKNDDDQTNSREGIDLTGVHHGGKTLRFEYTVVTADSDPDGVWVQTHETTGQLLIIRGTATITRLGTTVAAEVNKSGVATGAALDEDGIPMTYVNGRLNSAGPKPTGATVDGRGLSVSFDEDLAVLSEADLQALQLHFGVQGVDGTGGNRNAWQHPSGVVIHPVSKNILVLNLGVAARKNDVVTLSYKRFDHKGPIKDTDGNMAPAFVDFEVTNNTGGFTVPVPLEATVTGTKLEIVFNGELRASTTVPGGLFTVEASDPDYDRRTIPVSGNATASGTKVTVTLAEAVEPGELAQVSYNGSTGGLLKDGATNPPVQSFNGFRIETVKDATAPKLAGGGAVQTRAVPARSEVVLYFDEALHPNYVPAVGDFTVKVDLQDAVNPASVAIEANAVTLTVDKAVVGGTTLLHVVYTLPTDANAANRIRDLAGNEAAAFDTTSKLTGGLVASTVGTPVASTVTGADGKLVGNTGQSSKTSPLNVDFNFDQAQAFTTGSNSQGYRLTSVVFPYTGTQPGASTYTISIHALDASGDPGASLGMLSYSGVAFSATGGTLTHTASGTGINLDPVTAYYAILDTTTGSTNTSILRTDSPNEDAGAANGWVLEDATSQKGTSATAWIYTADTAWQIAIHGHEKLLDLKADGARVTLTYDSPLDPGSVPAPERFTLLRNDGLGDSVEYGRVTAVAVAGTELRLTLEHAVSPCEGAAPFTVTYGRSTTGKNIRTLTGHEAAGFAIKVANTRADQCVNGRVVVQDEGASGNSGGQGNQGKSLSLRFEAPLDTGKALKARAFKVVAAAGAAAAPTVENAAYATGGAGVVLALSRSPAVGEALTVSYTRAAGQPGLWTAAGKQIADFSGVEVPIRALAPPAVTGVAKVSDAGEDDTYGLGDVIRVRVTFSEAVEVEGSPRLKIDMEPAYWGDKWAVYESGAGTDRLTFAYAVVEPNESTGGIAVPADTLEANGGAIRAAAAGADAALAHTGLGHDPAHKVDWRLPPAPPPDTTAPALVSAAVNGPVLTLTFDEDLAAVDTGALPYAFFVGGILSNGSVSPGRVVIDGATVTLHLGSGAAPGQTVTVTYFADGSGNALRDAAGNAVAGFDDAAVTNLTPRPITVGAVRISSSPASGDTYALGETIRVTVAFGEAVEVTGSPRLTIDMDAANWGEKQAAYESGSGTSSLTFAYTVVEPNESTQGIAVAANSLAASGGTIRSAASGNDAELSHAGLDHDPAHKVDWRSGLASVTGVSVTSSPASGDTYLQGETIRVTVAFDRAVAVTGAPRLKIDMDPAPWGDKPALYEGGSGTSSLTFAYSVVEPNLSTQGIALLASTLEANGGTIRATGSSQDAELAHTGLGHDAAHKVDWRPTLSVADAEAHEGEDTAVEFAVTLSRPASGTVTVDFATADGTATAGEDYTATSGTLTFSSGEQSKTISVPLLDDAIDEGQETFTLTLSNPSRARILDGEATGTIINSDHMPRAWTARFGLTVAVHVVDAVEARLEGAAESYLQLGGQRLGGGAPPDVEASAQRLAPERDLWEEPDTADMPGQDMTPSQLLLGTAFHLVSEPGEEGGGPHLSAWGRVASSGFDGREEKLSLSGTVTTATLGVDGVWDRWLSGLLLAYSEGDGSFTHLDLPGGDVSSSLTSLHPYVAYTLSDRVRLWGTVGYGSGALRLLLEDQRAMDTDLTMTMGALGVRGSLLKPAAAGGLHLDLRSDVLWMVMDSAKADNLAATEAEASRLRLVLQGSRPVALAGGGSFTPSLEIGLRHDGGDAETGTGVEVGGSLRYASAWGLSIEASLRALVAHEEQDYREWGASGALRFDPGRQGRGLTAAIVPTWGTAASGISWLWEQSTAAGLAPDSPLGQAAAEGRLEAELGYGMLTLKGRALLTPYARVALVESADQAWHLGTRLALAESLNLSVEASRRQRAGDVPAHELALRARLGW